MAEDEWEKKKYLLQEDDDDDDLIPNDRHYNDINPALLPWHSMVSISLK